MTQRTSVAGGSGTCCRSLDRGHLVEHEYPVTLVSPVGIASIRRSVGLSLQVPVCGVRRLVV